jgi:hypothetical protein
LTLLTPQIRCKFHRDAFFLQCVANIILNNRRVRVR